VPRAWLAKKPVISVQIPKHVINAKQVYSRPQTANVIALVQRSTFPLTKHAKSSEKDVYPARMTKPAKNGIRH